MAAVLDCSSRLLMAEQACSRRAADQTLCSHIMRCSHLHPQKPTVSGALQAVMSVARQTEIRSRRLRCQADVSGSQQSHSKPSPGFGVPAHHQQSCQQWDVLGLGQAMVDFAASVSDDFLDSMGEEKGARRIISVEERGRIINGLDGASYQINAGGSLSNTLVALSRLSIAEETLHGRGRLRVAMAGVVGGDALGVFYASQLAKAGVDIISEAQPNSATGTVMVLTTPDANRTMLSYLGTQHEVEVDPLEAAIGSARMLVIEGYLWEMPNAVPTLMRAMAIARARGTAIALTAGDEGCVKRNRGKLLEALAAGPDVLFCNQGEAAALLGRDACSAEEGALSLGSACGVAVVTDGANGSCISGMGTLHVVPPYWSAAPPIDTCGAGDAYAAGLLYGYLAAYDIGRMGRAGARVASKVIGKLGAGLTLAEAGELASALAVPPRPPALSTSELL